MEVIDIIESYLKNNDYDGLYNSDAECGCGLDDLAPCGESSMGCHPAIEVVPPDEEFDRYFASKNWKMTDRIRVLLT